MDVRWIILTFLATNAGISRADLVLQPQGGVHVQFTKDNFMITCSALGKETTKLRWYDPSGNEITNSHGRIYIEQPSNAALMLVWLEAKREDEGTYKCTGDADGDEISFELIVYGPISFAKVEHEQRGKEGSNITIVCDAEGEPAPTISWKFKEVSLPLSQYISDIKHEAVGNGLKIYNLKREDAGNYTCCAMFATDLVSQVKYTDITLQVEYLPEWNNDIAEKSYSGIGHLANLTCEAEAEPSPIFEWRKNEETLQANNLYTMYSDHNKTVLQVSVYNESLFGGYDCIATNPVGSVSRRVFLEEGDAPNPPSVDVVSDEPGTLTLDIAPPADNMLEVTGYKVEYKLPSESWNNVQAIEFERGHQYMLKNLSHDTEYVVRVAARNMVGYGEYSNEITTRTKNLISDSVNDSAFSSQSSAIAALLSTSVSLWVLRL